jgi:hypothetical protein
MLTCDGRQEETLARAKNSLASPADYAIPFVGHLCTLRTSTNDKKGGGGCLWLGSTLGVENIPNRLVTWRVVGTEVIPKMAFEEAGRIGTDESALDHAPNITSKSAASRE